MPRHPEERAPWGDAARAVPGGAAPTRVPAFLSCPRRYPAPIERAPGPPPAAATKYERIDGPASPVTLGDTDAEVFRFSGRPDTIFLSARAFPAIVTLTSRLGGEATTILVPVDTTIETYVARDRVVARNAIAGSNAILSVVGKWAALDEPTSAY